MKLRRSLGLWAIVCLAVGCGGAATGSSPPAVGTAFASRAVAECQVVHAQNQKLHEQFHAHYPGFNPTQPDVSVFPGVARFMARTRDTYETWQRQMQALGQPTTGQAAWADFLKAIATHVRLEIEQHRRKDT